MRVTYALYNNIAKRKKERFRGKVPVRMIIIQHSPWKSMHRIAQSGTVRPNRCPVPVEVRAGTGFTGLGLTSQGAGIRTTSARFWSARASFIRSRTSLRDTEREGVPVI